MCDFKVSDGVMIIYLPKELDHYSADKIRSRCLSEFENNKIMVLIFDFEKTSFMDSSGIGLITGRFRVVHDNGGKVFVINVHDNIDKILEMSGIYRIISKKESKEDIITELLEGGYYE